MIHHLVRRLALAVPLLFVVSTAVFLLIHMIPGDPVDFMIGDNAAASRKVELRRALHLGDPLFVDHRPFTAEREVTRRLSAYDAARDREPLADLGRFAVIPVLEAGRAGRVDEAVAREVLADALLDHPAAAPPPAVIGASWSALAAYVDTNGAYFRPTGGALWGQVLFGSQIARYYRDLFTGELRSLHSGKPVSEALAERFAYTARLAGAALFVALAFALPLGTLAAWRQHSALDNVSMVAALVGISMPNFWLGPLLILVFSVELGWFPVSGAEKAGSLVLPAVTLGLGLASLLTRMTRAAVLETIREDFVRTARAKGLPELRVLFRHALRASLIPIVTIVGLQFGALLAGSIITEEIFGWPGIGREMVQGIRTRDFPIVQGCVLYVATSYVIVNAVTDVVYTWVNPRVRIDG